MTSFREIFVIWQFNYNAKKGVIVFLYKKTLKTLIYKEKFKG